MKKKTYAGLEHVVTEVRKGRKPAVCFPSFAGKTRHRIRRDYSPFRSVITVSRLYRR